MSKPEEMRQAMVDYIRTTHEAYQTRTDLLPPAARGRMPLVGEPFTVVAAGVQSLHVIATREMLPPPRGPEVSIEDAIDGMSWTVRFFDPVVVPGLGMIDESRGPAGSEVRLALGITTYLYHLVVAPGAGLGAHHAGHAGTGLANAHAAAAQDYDTLRRLHVPADLVNELEGAATAGLPVAHALIAARIAPDDETVATIAATPSPDIPEARRALLAAVRKGGP